MAALSGIDFHYQLGQVFSRNMNPLLDLLCETFLTADDLRRQPERTKRLGLLIKRMKSYHQHGATRIALVRMLLNTLLFVRTQDNLLRHFVPGGHVEPVKPQVPDRLAELCLLLLGLQEQETIPHRRLQFAQAAQVALDIYQGYRDILEKAGFGGLPPQEHFPRVSVEVNSSLAPTPEATTARFSSGESGWVQATDFMPAGFEASQPAEEARPPSSPSRPLQKLHVVRPEGDPPQGETIEWYKAHGYTSFLRKVEVTFLSGSYANRPCFIVRYNGKNTICFYPDDQTSHYISGQIPLHWARRDRKYIHTQLLLRSSSEADASQAEL